MIQRIKKAWMLAIIAALSLFIIACERSQEEPSLIKPDHVPEEQISEDILDAYSNWTDTYVRTASGGEETMYYVAYDETGSTVSEAHGYGMLITAEMAAYSDETKAHFDGMYHYFKHYPSANNNAFMAWKQQDQGDGTMINDNGEITGSATDGDMDIAYALLLADEAWGSDGSINYREEAITIINELMEDVIHEDLNLPLLGDWVRGNDPVYSDSTRTSDWMGGHASAFAEAAEDNRWEDVEKAIVDTTEDVQNEYSPDTGLLPDFLIYEEGQWRPAPAEFLERDSDGDYSYNAARVPWRMAESYQKTGNNQVREQLQRINEWAEADSDGSPSSLQAGYTLKGEALAEHTDMVFTAPLAAGASVDESKQDWLNQLWDQMTIGYGDSDRNYYNDSVRLLSMLTVDHKN